MHLLWTKNVPDTISVCLFFKIGLVFGDNRLSTVRAKTFCEIIMLTKPDLDDVLADFPIVARFVCFEIYMKFIYISHHFTAREDMNSTNWPRSQRIASQLSWSSIAPVSWRSWVRIPLKPWYFSGLYNLYYIIFHNSIRNGPHTKEGFILKAKFISPVIT